MKPILGSLILAFCLEVYGPCAWAKPAKPAGGSFTGGGTATIDKPLKVMGQTRTLSMMLVLKNKKEKIDFIKVRQNYQNEILNTQY
jgi:hypothetical protein